MASALRLSAGKEMKAWTNTITDQGSTIFAQKKGAMRKCKGSPS